jgi:4-diphosphocytidyl-2-C-methyl-D-erythritol kinase
VGWERVRQTRQVGSDVPLFLIGGSVLGSDRGQRVAAVGDVTLGGQTEIPCVIAVPSVGVSTPQAFRDWDRQFEGIGTGVADPDLHNPPIRDTLKELSRTFASVFPPEAERKSGASGIFPDPSSADKQNGPVNLQGLSREQRHSSLVSFKSQDESGIEDDLAENSLLALVRTGIENDFETVVFPQYPLLREIKRQLMGSPATENVSNADAADQNGQAIYAALSGSGSALFGLYRTQTDASAAQHRLQQHGVRAIVTSTIARPLYWTTMFAE